MDADTRIEIFRPGTFTSLEGTVVTFGDADLRAIADAYDGTNDPAPLVIGHPALEDPAYGWVDKLEVDGDRLVAIPRDVEPAFSELVRDKRYARVSARFYPKGASNSPKPAAPYLKHVGFLGAAAPAVKGLKPVSFSEESLAGTLTIDLPEQSKERQVAEETPTEQSFADLTAKVEALERQIADRDRTHAANAKAGRREAAMSFADGLVVELTDKVETLERQIADRDRTDAANARAGRREAAISFADGLVKAGRLAPAGKPLVVGILEGLDATTAISFGEGDANQLTPAAAFRKLFDGARPVISFGELAGRGDEPSDVEDPHAIAREAHSFADAEVAAGRQRPSTVEAVAHARRTLAANKS